MLQNAACPGSAGVPTRDVLELFRAYLSLYDLRNRAHGQLPPTLDREWKELSFTVDSVLAARGSRPRTSARSPFSARLPLGALRVPIDVAALCEDGHGLFAGVLRNLSRGGAYVQCKVPLQKGARVRFCFKPREEDASFALDGRVVWTNPGRALKHNLPEGGGIEFLNCPEGCRQRIRDHLCEVIEQALSSALLI